MKNSWYLLFLSRGKERRVHFASLEESSSYFKNSVSKSKQSMIETFARVTEEACRKFLRGRFSFRFAFLFSIDASGRIHENRKGYARTDLSFEEY